MEKLRVAMQATADDIALTHFMLGTNKNSE
jgi:hypothetical protein